MPLSEMNFSVLMCALKISSLETHEVCTNKETVDN